MWDISADIYTKIGFVSLAFTCCLYTVDITAVICARSPFCQQREKGTSGAAGIFYMSSLGWHQSGLGSTEEDPH